MPKAIRIHRTGGPEVLCYEDVEVPPPGQGEVLLRHTAIGVNYADINLRGGAFYLYAPLPLPAILGNEGVGVVEAVGPGVTDFQAGDRVAYIAASGTTSSPGGYSEQRVIDARRLARIPHGVSDSQAAASFIKGLTAWAIVRRAYPIKQGDVVLVHAAAGGVGSFLAQWSKHLGATVIGTVGSADKAKVARENGCDHVILYREIDFVKEVRNLYPKGIAAVFDGVGRDTYLKSFDCLKTFGMVVNFGNASGPPELLDVRMLSQKGSLFTTRVGMGHYIAEPADLEEAAAELFARIADGALRPNIERTYALKDAALAHSDIEARKTTGSVILIP
jgi:NADPH2:quinone reductase